MNSDSANLPSYVATLLTAILWLAPGLLRADEPPPEPDYSSELPRIAPLTPAEAIGQFELADGFSIQLVAAEPLVTDPVAFAFDGRGQLWVVEMRDYSEQERERLGRVALLVDRDGDGRMDQRTTFVENLSWPTAIWPWLDGVLVAEPPNITWFRDTDGNGVSDHSEVWYSGFGRSNVQGLVNSLRWGVDGWIHGATSSTGAQLESPVGGQRVDLGRRDFALDPLSKRLRAESGGGQHGMSFNRWGDKFVTSNSDHLQQIIDLESWLTGRSMTVPMPAVRRSIAEDGPQAEVYRASPVEPWRIVRTRLRMSGEVPGIVEGGGRAAGYFTGATGTWIMDHERGFGIDASMDTALVCDVGSNLVHRKRLIDQGLFWTAQRIDQQTELLRSRDIWFRPVQLGDGPDGALYIADMYREVIEHPQSLPPVIKKHLDLTSGRDRGRIWRITNAATPHTPYPNLTALNDQGLVERLQSEIAWQRLMASQLIVERHKLQRLDERIGRWLGDCAADSPRAESRLLALWLLERLGKWGSDLAGQAIQQPHPRVQAQAIEMIALTGNAAAVSRSAQQIAERCSDARVQLALVKLATELDSGGRQDILAAVMPHVTQPLVQASLAMAAGPDSWQLLQSAKAADMPDPTYRNWLRLLLPGWVASVPKNPHLLDFIKHSLTADTPRHRLWLSALAELPSHASAAQVLDLTGTQIAIDDHVDQALQRSPSGNAIELLGLTSTAVQTKWLDALLRKSSTEAQQTMTIQSLSWANHPQLSEKLVQQFRSFTPALQSVALRALSARPERLAVLAAALESQQIARSQIPPELRQQLLAQRDQVLVARLTKVLTQVVTDRAGTIQHYQSALASLESASGQTQAERLEAGQAIFQRACAQCHRLGEIGNDVGPPLRQLSDKSPDQLLVAILDPSQEVDPKYAAYNILTDDGVVITGLIVQETGSQIVIAEAGGKQTTLDRQSIEQIQSSGQSLMPNGLEEQITIEQMGQLIEFLKHRN
ncbi:MAG: c-type cytochrome [Pirellulaceae bacterium]|nr:c-type cytochrome [Pirellulaceae bacterium]